MDDTQIISIEGLPGIEEVDEITRQAWGLVHSDAQQGLAKAQEALQLAEIIRYKNGQAYASYISSVAHFRLGDYTATLATAQAALNVYDDLGDVIGKARALNQFASVYTELADYQDALNNYFQAFKLCEAADFKVGMIAILGNIAVIYDRLSQYDSAMVHHQRALVLSEELKDQNFKARALNGISNAYSKLNQPEAGLEYGKRALETLPDGENDFLLNSIYSNLGLIYQQLKDYVNSVDYLKRALDTSQKLGFKADNAENHLHLGEVYLEMEQIDAAKSSFEQALQIAEEIGARIFVYKAHLQISRLYKKLGEWETALKHHELYAATQDEVTNTDNQKAIAGLQARFNVEQAEKEREIYRLRNVELAEAMTSLKDANQEIATLNTRLKAENLRMRAELEITRRLQEMVLPGREELDAILDLDIAGYMQPADEVGGDYYDVLRLGGLIKIGIGDVTGHGLESGMLMLMVQTAVRTLMNTEEHDPVRFLTVLNKTIYDNVNRMHTDRSLTLVLLDYQDGKLRISGQHEEILVVRGSGELERVDTLQLGFPVGLEENIEAFISQAEIELAPDDVVVLYSDGITEAIDEKKNLYQLERLCEALLSSYKATAEEIKQTILEDLRRFAGRQRFRDDVTLLVIKRKS